MSLLALAQLSAFILAYRPFLDPLPVWQESRWPWLLIPLLLAVTVAYKSVRCKSMSRVPREALGLTVVIIVCMAGAALVLAVVVRGLEH
jgi:4-hydroxybenzoate polyprenyltransferase